MPLTRLAKHMLKFSKVALNNAAVIPARTSLVLAAMLIHPKAKLSLSNLGLIPTRSQRFTTTVGLNLGCIRMEGGFIS
jgi:hypothetical protein